MKLEINFDDALTQFVEQTKQSDSWSRPSRAEFLKWFCQLCELVNGYEDTAEILFRTAAENTSTLTHLKELCDEVTFNVEVRG